MTLNNLDVKVSALPSARHVRLPANRYFHAFLQERIQNEVQRSEKKAMCHLERARPKNVRLFIQEKSGGEVQKKINLLISDTPEIKEVSYLCLHSITLMRHFMSLNVRS